MEELIKCPKCSSTQLTANKKGFSGAKAVGGALLTGGIGLLAGTIGSNKVVITCLACGNTFKPGEDLESSKKINVAEAREFLKTEEGKAAIRKRYIKAKNLPEDISEEDFKAYIDKKNKQGNIILAILGIALVLIILMFFAC
jgi:predicted nucleic-acid-binding Zn-ribbon protein